MRLFTSFHQFKSAAVNQIFPDLSMKISLPSDLCLNPDNVVFSLTLQANPHYLFFNLFSPDLTEPVHVLSITFFIPVYLHWKV